jgi:hypothetical protein
VKTYGLCIALTGFLAACAHAPSNTTTQTASAAESEQYEKLLTDQLARQDVAKYVTYIDSLPQPERWERAKEFFCTNHLMVVSAFDKEHPVPTECQNGPAATVP